MLSNIHNTSELKNIFFVFLLNVIKYTGLVVEKQKKHKILCPDIIYLLLLTLETHSINVK